MREESMPKLVSALKHYSVDQFVKDLTAGVIVAIIALPLSIALALASGVGPEQGIYTAIVAGFVIAVLGGSRVQISGPTAAFATIVAGIVATKGMNGLDRSDDPCGSDPDPYGTFEIWSAHPLHSAYDRNRIYSRNCSDDRDRSIERLFRTDVPEQSD